MKQEALTDFNDLHVAAGIGAVRQQLLDALALFEHLPPPPAEAAPEPEPDLPPAPPDDEYAAQRSDSSAQDDFDFPPPPGREWIRKLKRTDKGTFQANIFNTQLILANDSDWAGVLGYCDFSYRVMKLQAPPFSQSGPGEWTDADSARLRIWLCQHYGFTPKTADADDAVLVVAQANRMHPVRDYLNSLEWDGVERVETWLYTYMGATHQSSDAWEKVCELRYIQLVSTMWPVAAVARVMNPPIKADCVLILEGLQGLGKSTALEILGGDWFSDTHFALGEKDGYQQMQGVWICELAELDSFNKAESTRAKQFFGSKEDRYRPAYGRRAQAFARQCVFAGSTNQDSYLKDPTGNRRYWPVLCHKLDADALRRDRDQLWAEAVHLYRQGVPWWVQESDKGLFESQQEQRYDADAWEDLIEAWLRDPMRREESHTTAAIMQGALKMEPSQIKTPEQARVGRIMARFGWKRRYSGTRNSRQWVYTAPAGWFKPA